MIIDGVFISALWLQLFYIAFRDLTVWKISNASNFSLAITYIVYRLTVGDAASLISHGLLSVAMLLVLLFPFAKGWIGGGDAKFLVVAVLWVGPECAFVFSVVLTLCTLIYAAVSRYGIAPRVAEGARHRMPFGCPGAAALGLTLLIC